ncbi:glycosyltransferase family 4 protein [Limosilactobacillus agrestis]|uniref:glycosyltransferase family 4 protein n=1 Tax=Limosilactobacillus agrestis TaxID=2759748 RepID=UPI001E2FC4B2|nr:glycosyltransferase family 4 protein [Limosilactobacillus agrestis]MCD7112827.1 glycosyltransferase family 4 protein [Limosilactobacillus agrestis]
MKGRSNRGEHPKMKILYCITSSSWGGAQLHVLELCADQLARGNEVTFIVGNKGPLLDKVKQLKGVKVILLPSLVREISPTNDIKAIVELRKIIKSESPDIVHLHSSKAGVIGRLSSIGLRRKIKVIFTVHGWAFTDGVSSRLKKSLYRIIEKSVRHFTDLFICVSYYDEKIGKRDKVLDSTSNVKVIHNGSITPSEQNINYSVHTPLRLVMIARFSPQKDQETLINAVTKLPKDRYKLTFVGDGETLQTNKELVSKYGLDHNIKFTGFKDDISDELINNDVYILSTHYEGLPISIIEAMSYGLPILATNVGGNSEMLENNINGFLFTSKDELAEKLNYLINNPETVKKMGQKSYRIFSDEYSLSKCLTKINNSYLELLD